jgi:hypothetical protein
MINRTEPEIAGPDQKWKKPTEEIWTVPKKRYNAEEIIHRLGGADVLPIQGKPSTRPAS